MPEERAGVGPDERLLDGIVQRFRRGLALKAHLTLGSKVIKKKVSGLGARVSPRNRRTFLPSNCSQRPVEVGGGGSTGSRGSRAVGLGSFPSLACTRIVPDARRARRRGSR